MKDNKIETIYIYYQNYDLRIKSIYIFFQIECFLTL